MPSFGMVLSITLQSFLEKTQQWLEAQNLENFNSRRVFVKMDRNNLIQFLKVLEVASHLWPKDNWSNSGQTSKFSLAKKGSFG